MRRLDFSLVLASCFEPTNDGSTLDEYDDDDLPSGVCRDTGTDTEPCDTDGTTIGDTDTPSSTTGDVIEDECQASADCMGGFCAAPFDPDTLQRSPKACQFMCVPLLDDTLWCSDDAACCDEDATCTERGYCVLP
jgi:hypothetical protein